MSYYVKLVFWPVHTLFSICQNNKEVDILATQLIFSCFYRADKYGAACWRLHICLLYKHGSIERGTLPGDGIGVSSCHSLAQEHDRQRMQSGWTLESDTPADSLRVGFEGRGQGIIHRWTIPSIKGEA